MAAPTFVQAGTINGGSVAIGVNDDWGVIGFALIPVSGSPLII